MKVSAAAQKMITNARAYLRKYWPQDLDSECEFIVTFLHDVFANKDIRRDILGARSLSVEGTDVLERVDMVDVGGGPVVDKSISASSVPRINIHHLEPSEDARREIHMWLKKDKDAYPHWTSRFQYVAKLEGTTAIHVERRVRGAIRYVGDCNLMRGWFSEPKEFTYAKGYPTIVSCHSVLACISQTKDDFERALDGLVSLCGRGTLLILTVNVDTTRWCLGSADEYAPAYKITAKEVLRSLASRGFDHVRLCKQHSGSDDVSTAMPSTLAVAVTRSAK